jgi:hypothetical protein
MDQLSPQQSDFAETHLCCRCLSHLINAIQYKVQQTSTCLPLQWLYGVIHFTGRVVARCAPTKTAELFCVLLLSLSTQENAKLPRSRQVTSKRPVDWIGKLHDKQLVDNLSQDTRLDLVEETNRTNFARLVDGYPVSATCLRRVVMHYYVEAVAVC